MKMKRRIERRGRDGGRESEAARWHESPRRDFEPHRSMF
jgi:hypothetical protein